MANQSILVEFWDYMKTRKKFWLLPIVICMLLMGGLIILGQVSPALSPFVYALF